MFAILFRGLCWSALCATLFWFGQNCQGAVAVPDGTNLVAEASLNSVRSITLPHFEPQLQLAPGRPAFLAACGCCHSALYVTMQPPFTRKQWEETVDKMTKVYGAQIAPEQRNEVIEYLLATEGLKKANSDDDDFGSVSAKPALPDTHSVPALQSSPDAMVYAKQIAAGEKLFIQNCAACHGAKGRGDGMVSAVLWRKPKDLAATRFSLKLLSEVLWNGKPGTAMPSWRTFPEADLSALAAYVQSLHRPMPQPQVTAEMLQQGNRLFQQNCVPCHGTAADGKGTAAAALLPPPSNFQVRQPDFNYILQVLRDGVPGTGMPSWKDQLSEADRASLAGFLRSMFVETNDLRR
jgi:mono/diheme cytochrome c family protein